MVNALEGQSCASNRLPSNCLLETHAVRLLPAEYAALVPCLGTLGAHSVGVERSCNGVKVLDGRAALQCGLRIVNRQEALAPRVSNAKRALQEAGRAKRVHQELEDL
eukprot:15471380-Alexandrium_andersonii.AAC.1